MDHDQRFKLLLQEFFAEFLRLFFAAWAAFFDLDVVRFQYLYVGLPGLPAESYRTGDNVLGVALSALMNMPREERARAALEALRRVVESPENPWRKFLLGDCILAYAPLDEAQRQEFERQVQSGPYKE